MFDNLTLLVWYVVFFFSSRRRHTRSLCDWSSDVCSSDLKVYVGWNEVALALGAPVPTAAELAQGLDRTWQFMADCLARWSPADMHQTFPDDRSEERRVGKECRSRWSPYH